MTLPKFTYHPDPLATGAVVKSMKVCDCCGEARGYLYSGSIYSQRDVEWLCPWCIADGSAAREFKASYSDDFPLDGAGLKREVIAEVCQRTPGYQSWRQEVWLDHCGDACEFHGFAEHDELKALSGQALQAFLSRHMLKANLWQDILDTYEKGGNPAVYKFRCRHCGDILYGMDFL
ncbi:CbrC family protein [Photobacterium sp. SP02]|uniref:CbrC family protein n=1 Tax=Photobacterium TaxID=657 RepID=UPI000EA23974|nr:CbrC family protein [Photobacterium salinisoli]NAW85849.1 hypothetical protein [Photobacterium halotolerans]NAX45713.1 hypothetical protein [Photobacterium halotolerans]